MIDKQLHSAIGIGSNSVRLLIARRSGSTLEAVKRMERVTRLSGSGVTPGGEPRLEPAAVQATIEAAREFLAAAQELDAPLAGVIATEAVRAAANRDDLSAAIEQELGVPLTIISGEEEAALGWRAVSSDYSDLPGPLGVIDVGGGSSDLSVGDPTRTTPENVLSIPFGARAAMRRYGLHKPVEYTKTAGIITGLRIEINDRAAAMQPRPTAAVAIGGTAEVLARVYSTIEGATPDSRTPISRDWLGGHLVRLAALDAAGRIVRGVPEDRADVAVAGGVILLVLLDAWALGTLYLSDRGILDGYLLEGTRD